MPTDEMVEKAQTLDDAIDNALIAWGMGWDMDGVMACLKEAKDRAALAAMGEPASHPLNTSAVVSHETGNVRDKAAAWEHFRDESYFDLWCVRPTGEKTFGVGFHVSTEAEAIALVETLAGKASPRPEAVGEAFPTEPYWECTRVDDMTREELLTAFKRLGELYERNVIGHVQSMAAAIRSGEKT